MARILLLDIDGVVKSLEGAPWSIPGSDWKRGVDDFLSWCQEAFDIVMVLSSWQAHIHQELESIGFSFPSLAWKQAKTEGLAGLCAPNNHVIWVEDGWHAADRATAEALGIILVETEFNEGLSITQEKIEQAIGPVTKRQGFR